MQTATSLLAFLLFALDGISSAADPLDEGTQAFKENDFVRALLLLQPLADQGNAHVQAMVGEMFLLGCCGVAEDLESGLSWIP